MTTIVAMQPGGVPAPAARASHATPAPAPAVRPSRASRGSALVVAMMAVLLAGTAAAALAELGRLATERARLARDGMRAWFLAETALADVLARVPPDLDFTVLLAASSVEVAAGSGWSYVTAVDDDRDETPDDPTIDHNGRVRLRIVATGPPPIRRRLEATLARATEPFWPAAALLAGGVNDLTTGFVLDGRDYRMSNGCENAGTGAARYGVALPPSASSPTSTSGTIAGTGPSPSVMRLEPPDVGAAGATPGATHYPAGALDGALGTAATPRLTTVDGDATVDGGAAGFGALIVNGRLRIMGALDFTGVVAARGGVIVEATGHLTVCGGLWAASDPALTVRGNGRVRASAEALAVAARVAHLPSQARVAAVRELF